MNSLNQRKISLNFPLSVEDDWPPVATESLPFYVVEGGYECRVAPLFVKDLSVGDVISAELGCDQEVLSWRHVYRSLHSTVWLLRLKRPNTIDAVLAELRRLGCGTVGLDEAGCYAVDVPESIAMETVDKALENLDAGSVATAFPSMRHPDS